MLAIVDFFPWSMNSYRELTDRKENKSMNADPSKARQFNGQQQMEI
jgi:hypothetical protein